MRWAPLFAVPERHTLTVTGLNRAELTVFGPRTGIKQDVRLGSDGTFRLRLPKDDYTILGVDDSLAEFDGSSIRTGTRTLLAATGIRTDQDRTVTLDGRRAGKVSARTDHRDATATSTSASLELAPERGGDSYSLTVVAGSKATMYATPTAQAPGVTYAASTTLTGKDSGGAYRYSLRQTHKGGIPADTNPVVHDRQLATVHAAYASQGGKRAAAVRSDLPSSRAELMPFIPTLRTALPSRSTEYYSVAPGLTWSHYLDLFGTTDTGPDGTLPEHDETTAVRRHQAGHTYGIDWNRAPVGPGRPQPRPQRQPRLPGPRAVRRHRHRAAPRLLRLRGDTRGRGVLRWTGHPPNRRPLGHRLHRSQRRRAPLHPDRPHHAHRRLDGSRHSLHDDLGLHLGTAPRLDVLGAAAADRTHRWRRRPQQHSPCRPYLPRPAHCAAPRGGPNGRR
ncbi:hypothetical protein ACFYN9_09005 [Streptomyces collinus]|uniref:Uncharacterized protein n=1 Tax=Streptomyces collinus TaxID=42684 RepID=A0AA89QEZ2_STRCU|nr:hypothetical protein [Streptomyces collinus]MBB5815661.1 hypothetical protein [Streptomyces collinus]WMX68553.1 hypothetical protein RFN52_36570 [Streptomyces collinus]